YTGRLIAEMAVERGLRPVLAGRNADKLAALAGALDLDYQAFALDDRAALDAALAEVPLVLHCAGPFVRTAGPMAEACLRTGTHYLDVTGEISVYEQLAALDAQARAAEVMLLPGVGFDVVPTDCLALHLKHRLPSATHLELAIMGLGRLSHGTATTMVENIGSGGAVRRDGRLEPVPAAWKRREVDFGRGPVTVVSIPWGDVATAYHSTGIPNIVVYAALGKRMPGLLRLTRYTGWLLASPPAQVFFKWMIRRQPPGPSAEQRAQGRSFVWGTVWDDDGGRATARLKGPEGYAFTALAALALAEKGLDGEAVAGFQTPAKAFGPDFVLDIAGVTRVDL
ncbi:MAG: trans-acting enoyl reductase family protein, partial [Rhodothermales bacterium]